MTPFEQLMMAQNQNMMNNSFYTPQAQGSLLGGEVQGPVQPSGMPTGVEPGFMEKNQGLMNGMMAAMAAGIEANKRQEPRLTPVSVGAAPVANFQSAFRGGGGMGFHPLLLQALLGGR